MQDAIVQAAGQYGPTGLLILYLIYDKATLGKERAQLDRERIAADKELAASLATLATLVKGQVR